MCGMLVVYVCVICALCTVVLHVCVVGALCTEVCRCMYSLRVKCASIDIGLCIFGVDVSMYVVSEVVSGTLYFPLYNSRPQAKLNEIQ